MNKYFSPKQNLDHLTVIVKQHLFVARQHSSAQLVLHLIWLSRISSEYFTLKEPQILLCHTHVIGYDISYPCHPINILRFILLNIMFVDCRSSVALFQRGHQSAFEDLSPKHCEHEIYIAFACETVSNTGDSAYLTNSLF